MSFCHVEDGAVATSENAHLLFKKRTNVPSKSFEDEQKQLKAEKKKSLRRSNATFVTERWQILRQSGDELRSKQHSLMPESCVRVVSKLNHHQKDNFLKLVTSTWLTKIFLFFCIQTSKHRIETLVNVAFWSRFNTQNDTCPLHCLVSHVDHVTRSIIGSRKIWQLINYAIAQLCASATSGIPP